MADLVYQLLVEAIAQGNPNAVVYQAMLDAITTNASNADVYGVIVEFVSPFKVAYYDAAVLADAPLLYWKLDEAPGSTTVADSSGHGITGTVGATMTLGSPSIVPTTARSCASALGTPNAGGLKYAPTTAIIQSGVQASLELPSVTLEFWVKTIATLGSGTLVAYGSDATVGFPWGVYMDAPRPDGTSLLAREETGTIADDYADSAYPLSPSTLYHIVYVIAPSANLLYANGVLVNVGYGTDTNGLPHYSGGYNTGGLTINCDGGAYTDFDPGGSYANVAVYNGALSPARIAAHYMAGAYSQLSIPYNDPAYLPKLAIAPFATSPVPAGAGSLVWSTITQTLLMWNGKRWTTGLPDMPIDIPVNNTFDVGAALHITAPAATSIEGIVTVEGTIGFT